MEESAECKEVQMKKLESTVKSLSEELIKVGILPVFNKNEVLPG